MALTELGFDRPMYDEILENQIARAKTLFGNDIDQFGRRSRLRCGFGRRSRLNSLLRGLRHSRAFSLLRSLRGFRSVLRLSACRKAYSQDQRNDQYYDSLHLSHLSASKTFVLRACTSQICAYCTYFTACPFIFQVLKEAYKEAKAPRSRFAARASGTVFPLLIAEKSGKISGSILTQLKETF